MPPSASQETARPAAARPWLAAAKAWIDQAAEPRRRQSTRSTKRPALE